MKKYILYLLPIVIIIVILYNFLSLPKISINVKEPHFFTIMDFLGEIVLLRSGEEISVKKIPLPLKSKDEVKINPFSGITILSKDSTLFTCYPLSNISIEEKTIHLKKGSLEWRKGKGEVGININNTCVLYPSGSGRIEVNGKINILSFKNGVRIKIDGKEENLESLEKAVIENGKLTKEKIENPPVLLSPKENQILGSWTEDFGLLNISIEYSQRYDQLQLEISPDPYFLSTMFTTFLNEKNFKIPLEKIGTGRRFVKVTPIKGKTAGIPSEPVEFFVKAFPFSKASERGLPPKIDIYSVILSGNIVIVKGKVDRGCRLFVNKEEVTPEPNGEFNVPITFNDIGEKWLEIEAVSPSGLRSTKRQKVFLVGY